MRAAPVSELSGVSKTYGAADAAVTALVDVDLGVAAGEVVVALGPSGSGKTTLVDVMGGIDPSRPGQVVLDGRDLSGLGAEQLASARHGTVGSLQSFSLIATLSAAENVRIVAELTDDRARDISFLVNDLARILLRNPIGADPLTAEGIDRWASEATIVVTPRARSVPGKG